MEFRHQFLIYCLKRTADGRYAVLNRRYKPIGFGTMEWVNYEDYPILIKFKRLTAPTIIKLSSYGDPNADEIFLYSDKCIPTRSAAHMRAYLDRIALLAKLQLE